MKLGVWTFHIIVLLLTAACMSSAVKPPALTQNSTGRGTQSQNLRAKIDNLVVESINRVPIAGMSVVVLDGNKTVLAKGYGVTDVKSGAPASAETEYRIGSVTKMITAVGIMKLVERGRLRLDDSLKTHIPEAPVSEDVTIRNLLNHTSGLPDHEQTAVERWLREGLPITTDYVWSLIKEHPIRPAQVWQYTSSSFHVLGVVIERISGLTYDEFVRREIAMPFKLTSMRLCSGAEKSEKQAHDYVVTEGTFAPDKTWDVPGIFSAGGICASAVDIASLIRNLATGNLLNAPAAEKMTTPTTIPGGVRADYGLGVRLGALDGWHKWGHTGGGAHSNRSAAAYYPKAELTIVVLMNTEREDSPTTAIDVESQIARVVLGLPPIQVKDLPLPEDSSRYTGRYEFRGVQSEITVEDGHLMSRRVGETRDPVVLRYQGEHEFVPFTDSPAFRYKFQMVKGHAVAFASYDNGWFGTLRTKVK